MALSFTGLANGFWGDTTPTLVSSTYTPTAPGLLNVIFVVHTSVAPVADATGISGNPITNVQRLAIQPYQSAANPVTKVEVFVARSTATAGTITLALSGTPTGAFVQVVEVQGAHLSHGQLGVVQVVGANSDASVTAVNFNMNTFMHPANGCLVAIASGQAVGTTPKTGWTEINDGTMTSPNLNFEIQAITQNDPNPQGTISSANWGAIAVEITGGPVLTLAHREILLQPSTPQLLPTERLIVPRPTVVLGTITGTLATTNANDTSAAAGSTTVTGALARTNANDTLAANGSAGAVSGTLATTNANDTLSAAGTTTVTGTLAKTNNNDTSVAAGTTKILGTSATTNANDTLAAAGTGNTNFVPTPAPAQQPGGTLSGRRGPYTPVDAELEAILRDDDEVLCLI